MYVDTYITYIHTVHANTHDTCFSYVCICGLVFNSNINIRMSLITGGDYVRTSVKYYSK